MFVIIETCLFQSDPPEQKSDKKSHEIQVQTENHDLPSNDKQENEESSQEKSLPEEGFLDENHVEKNVADETGAEDSSSMVVLPLPSLPSKASPKRITKFTIGKVSTTFKFPPSSPAKSTSSLVSNRSSMAGQKQLLDRFCWKLLHDGMEVLKLNSDKIWQTRYLTVSKEVTRLANESDDAAGGESSNFPKALLWVKKFPSSKDQSVNGIEKNGKGGILFSHVARVEELTGRHIPVSKKQLQGKFKDSVIVMLKSNEEGGSKTVYFRCGTRQEALVLCAGCNMISKMMHANKQPLLPVNSNKMISPANSTSIDNNKSKIQVFESKKVEVEGDNDLWEV